MMIKNKVFGSIVSVLGLVGVILVSNSGLWAKPMKFATLEAASDELIGAIKARDIGRMKTIFGEKATSDHPIIEDNKNKLDSDLNRFVQAYEKRHFFDKGDETILCVGKTGWPFFIPLVADAAGEWMFDLASGVKELSIRRIGKNELFVMTSLNAYVDGQREFFRHNYSKSTVRTYAQKFFSKKGAYDGLYWRRKKGSPVSPLGPYLAWAEQSGRKSSRNKPYSGYYYKILTRQGVAGEGGEYSYIVNGKMVFGFALIAWPADYGNTGIMSFIVNHHDKIYEKDLGEETGEAAKSIDSFDPDDSWSQVDNKWME